MTPHETIENLLALSAAGLLDPAAERTVREHVRECGRCAARLESLGALGASLAALPAPAPPIELVLRTQSRMAAEMAAAADRRQGSWLAIGGAALGWLSWLVLWSLYRVLTGGVDSLLRPVLPGVWVWLAFALLTAALAAPTAAALDSSRRAQRRM